MALSGMLISAQFIAPSPIAQNPKVTLSYDIEVKDDVLGVIGVRSYRMSDPTVTASVMAYIQQMLPSIEAQTGIPITVTPEGPQPTQPDYVP